MKKIIGFTVFILAITLFSCQNEKVVIPEVEGISEKSAQITLTEVKLESAATAVEYEVDFYANAEETLTRWWKQGKIWRWTNKLRYRINECPDVTIESEEGGYPKTITLNYGESTVLESGRVLSGIIIIEISGPRNSGDYKRDVTYDNFGVDSLLVNGNSVVTKSKTNDVFSTFKSDMTFTLANGMVIDRTSERVWEWLQGMETVEDQTDDIIQITGQVNAENSNGDTYKKEIVEPLIRLGDCKYIVQGIVEITINSELEASIDYGDGNCNNIAILTKDGETYEIDLSKRTMNKGKKRDNG